MRERSYSICTCQRPHPPHHTSRESHEHGEAQVEACGSAMSARPSSWRVTDRTEQDTRKEDEYTAAYHCLGS